MKKTAFVLVLALIATTAFSQTAITQVAIDMETLFTEIGKDIMPGLQTASVLNHELGAAEHGNFPRMYFSVSAGATAPGGVLTFLEDEELFENPGLFSQVTDEITDNEAYDIITEYFPLPSIRGTFGIGLFGGWEANVQLASVPQNVTDMVASDQPVAADVTTIGLRVRKVLVSRERGLLPSISAGVGYTYSNLDFGYDLAEIDPLEIDDTTNLALNGEVKFVNRIHSFGADVRASTRFLAVFHPFIGASAYYQSSTYEAGIDGFDGTLEISGQIPIVVEPAVEPFSEQELRDVNVVLNTGVDIRLLILNVFVHGNYALSTRAPGAVVGVRLQF